MVRASLLIPKAVTTSSFNCLVLEDKVTVNLARVPTSTDFSWKPTPLKISVALLGTDTLKFPFTSVAVPVPLPFTWIVIPGNGDPSSPVTCPLTVRSCAYSQELLTKSIVRTRKILLIQGLDFGLY